MEDADAVAESTRPVCLRLRLMCECLEESKGKREADGIDPNEADQDKPDRCSDWPGCKEKAVRRINGR